MFNKEAHYLKKVVTLEKNKEKIEAKNQKLGSKDSSRLIRNYKKREDAIKQGNVLFEEFRGVFLSCVQNRFAIGNPVVRKFVEHKIGNFTNLAREYKRLFDEREILNMQDDINAYKDRLFQSRIGDISGVSTNDLQNQSNLFNSQLVGRDKLSFIEPARGFEPARQDGTMKQAQTMDFKRKPTGAVEKKNEADFDQISSIHNSSMAKEDEKAFMDDDPFNFDAFDTIKKSGVKSENPINLHQQKSPVINFKTKASSFKTQEYKAKDLQEVFSVPKEEPFANQKSKFDFDFGSFAPPQHKPVHEPQPVATHIEHRVDPVMQPDAQDPSSMPAMPPPQHMQQQPVFQHPQPVYQPGYEAQAIDETPVDPQYNHVPDHYAHNESEFSNYNDNTEQEMQNIQQHAYGQFDQGEDTQPIPAYQDQPLTYHQPLPNSSPRPTAHPQEEQQYPIHIEKNVDSDEEFTYY